MTLGGIVAMYILVVGLINTSKDGEMMGKKWASTWIMLRVAMGTLLMAPIPGHGFCTIQALVMWIVLQGVGAANSIWSTALDYLGEGFTLGETNIQQPFSDIELQPLATNLLQSNICMLHINAANRVDAENHSDLIIIIPENNVLEFGIAEKRSIQYKSICGKITVKSPNTKIKLQAVEAMRQSLMGLAREIVKNDNLNTTQNRKKFAKGVGDTYLIHASRIFNETVATVLPDKNKNSDELNSVIARAKNYGWAHAGSYYIYAAGRLAKAVDISRHIGELPQGFNITRNYDILKKDIAASFSDVEAFSFTNDAIKLKNQLLTASAVMNHALKTTSMHIGAAPQESSHKNSLSHALKNIVDDTEILDDSFSDVIDKIQEVKGNTALALKNLFTGDSSEAKDQVQATMRQFFNPPLSVDPLIFISNIGTTIMHAAEFSWVTYMLPYIDNSDGKKQSHSILHTMMTIGLGLLWGAGAGMGIYLPLVPYLIFTTSVLGWFIAVVEAMIAAPMIALAFSAPSQDELGKTMPGIMQITTVFLRPTLLVIGFIITTRVIKAAIIMINFSFGSTVAVSLPEMSLMGTATVLIIYVAFILAIVNKCTTFIVIFADKILKVIGASPDSFREEEVLGKTQGTFDQGKGTVQQVQQAQTGKISDFIQRATKSGISEDK